MTSIPSIRYIHLSPVLMATAILLGSFMIDAKPVVAITFQPIATDIYFWPPVPPYDERNQGGGGR